MGKSTPQAPTPPDPQATANAQQGMNINTAIANAELNRVNQNTPQGSLTYQIMGYNPDGTPQYQQTQTYSPQQQALYQGQNQVAQSLTQTANNALTDVNNAYSTPYSTAGFTPLQTSASGGNVQTGYAPGGNIQTSLNFSGAPALPGVNDFSADATGARNNAYSYATSRLDPQFNLEQQQLASTLAAKGVTENSTAYRNAMDEFSRQKTDAYNQATYGSYAAGGDEQSRLFGLALQGRQEAVGETGAQGQFANAAQAQGAQQNLQQGVFANTAQAQQFQQSMQNAGLADTVRQQQIAEYTAQRNEPLNRVGALLGGPGVAAQNPSFQGVGQAQVAGVNYAQLVQNQYEAQQQQYLQQLQAQQSGLGSIFGLAGSLGGAALLGPLKNI